MSRSSKTIRDPVHGDIRVLAEDLGILDAPELQRMRRVNQLGTAFHVYPGAQHSRFEHLLGTYYMARKLIEGIRRNHLLDASTCLNLSEQDTAVIRAVALLHDITHIPHGHAIEDQDGLFPRHDKEEILYRAVSQGQVGADLRARGIFDLVAGHVSDTPRSRTPYLSLVVNGHLGADMLDYLRRDAYFTGLRIDYDDRLLDFVKIDPTSGLVYVDLVKHNMDREDVLTEVLNLLHSRYVSSERIYYHHAKVASGALISRAVELAIAGGLSREDVAHTGDEEMLLLLRERAAGDPSGGRAISGLLDRYANRQLLKRCFVATRRGDEALQDDVVDVCVNHQNERKAIETSIAQALDIADPSQIIVYCPKKEMQLKEASVLVRRVGKGIRPLSEYADEFPVLNQLVRGYRDLWKLYVFVPLKDEKSLRQAGNKVGAILNRRFPGIVNRYQR